MRMCEPEKKRRKCSSPTLVEVATTHGPGPPCVRLGGLEDWTSFQTSLSEVHSALLTRCLCGIQATASSMDQTLAHGSLRLIHELEPGGLGLALRDSMLLFCTCAQLLFEEISRQANEGVMCSQLNGVKQNLLLGARYDITPALLALVSYTDRWVSYAAGQALAAWLRVASEGAVRVLLERMLAEKLPLSLPTSPHAQDIHLAHSIAHVLDALRASIELREDIHPLEDREDFQLPLTCVSVRTRESLELDEEAEEPEELDSHFDLKGSCIRALGRYWSSVVTRFHMAVAAYSLEENLAPPRRESLRSEEFAIFSFLSLWQASISVKANLSVVDTKPYYARLESFVPLLTPHLPTVLWKKLVDLLNEVLCYGSTLALQDFLADEPCNLSHLIIRHVKNERLLERVPYREGCPGFAGLRRVRDEEKSARMDQTDEEEEDGDRPLLQKVVLLVLKSVAVTVKETRCESSSEGGGSSRTSSEAGSGGSGSEDADMAVISRSIRQVLRVLDSRIKCLLPFHPETPLAEWIVKLFADQDDALVEGLLCTLDIYTGLASAISHQPDFARSINPTVSWLHFLQTVSYDPDVLLDLLVSNETCFLLYLLRSLKYIRRHWSEFVSYSDRQLDDAMTVFIRLRIAIKRLVSKSLFPYNIGPIVRLLEKCEAFYEGRDH